MSEWKEYKRTTVADVDFIVKERSDLRNQHGSMEYSIEAYIGGQLIYVERCEQSKWLGHCYGQLLLPEVANRAKKHNQSTKSNTSV